MMSKLKNYLVIIIFSVISINSASAIELKKKLPKIGGSSSEGVNLDEAKTKFTKIFFESTLNYMEAQYHLFNALEKNDRAGKTRKAIDFVKNDKNKEGKRLTNAFNTVSDNSKAIEGALTKEAANSAEAKVHYAKALPFAVSGLIGTVQLPPEAKSLLDSIKADKTAMLKLGAFVKVLPKIPGYVKNATQVGKMIVSGAKSRDVEGAADATAAMGDL